MLETTYFHTQDFPPFFVKEKYLAKPKDALFENKNKNSTFGLEERSEEASEINRVVVLCVSTQKFASWTSVEPADEQCW